MLRKIDWHSGSGMAIACYAVMMIIVYIMIWVIEPSGWYWKIAISQTRTDAICDGAAAVGDTGYIDASALKPHSRNQYKDETEINVKAVAKKANEIYAANKNIIKDTVKNFTLNDNTGENGFYMLNNKLSYGQRVYAVLTSFESDNIFRALSNNQYKMASNSFTRIVGVEKALLDTTRFSEMYSDDIRIPVAPLTNVNSGTMQGVFNSTEEDEYGYVGKGQAINDLNDGYSAALYKAVLDQFNVEAGEKNGSERYKAAQNIENSYCDDYVYSRSNEKKNLLIPVSDTLLWDISVAMGKELPRYRDVTKSLNDKSNYYEWEKGRKNVQITTIDIQEATQAGLLYTITGVDNAAQKANEGVITFAVKGNVYYFVRPTRSDGTAGAHLSNGSKKLPCLYSNGMDNCSNNELIKFSDTDIFYCVQ